MTDTTKAVGFYVHVCAGEADLPPVCTWADLSPQEGLPLKSGQCRSLQTAFPGDKNHKDHRLQHSLTTLSLLTIQYTYWEVPMTHRWRKHCPKKQEVWIPDLILPFCYFLESCFLMARDGERKPTALCSC